MDKIQMKTPIVEIDGDEMTRVIWDIVKKELILPYIDLNTEYYDLGLRSRDNTRDKITADAAEAIKKYGVGVKCATITPNKARMEEYHLKELYPSPNGTLRAILDGTVFRAPIIVSNIAPYIPSWKSPITIARHAYGDIYKGVEMKVDGPGTAELVFTAADGSVTRKTIKEFQGPGVLMGQHNLNKSIESFARSCFNYALDTRQDLWFSSKDTISKIYDGEFKEVFNRIYETEYKDRFMELGIQYMYTLIDDCVARVIKSEGGFIWACKNYDGDVMSDMLATAYGALAMMTSVLVSPDGCYEYEAAHGTVQRHYYKYQKGEETSTNSVATIFAWTGAFRKRGQLDGNKALMDYADKMEKCVLRTIQSGRMTKDLAMITTTKEPKVLNTKEFILAVKAMFDGKDKDIEVYKLNLDEEKAPEEATPVSKVKASDDPEALYESFLDSNSYRKKREILSLLRNHLTDKMITDFAVSLDVVVEDGPIDMRYLSLMRCLDQLSKFESTGLR